MVGCSHTIPFYIAGLTTTLRAPPFWAHPAHTGTAAGWAHPAPHRPRDCMGSPHTLAGLRLGDADGVADGPAARAADDLAGARVRAAVRGGPRPERARRRRAHAGPGGWKRERCAHAVLRGYPRQRSRKHRSRVWVVDGGRGHSRGYLSGHHPGILGYFGVLWVSPGYYIRSTLGDCGVPPSGRLGYSGVLWGTLGYSGVLM